MSYPETPAKSDPTISRVAWLYPRNPEALAKLVKSGKHVGETLRGNYNAEVVNFDPYNAFANVERSRANIRAGMVTPPPKGTGAMKVFGTYGKLPSQSGDLMKAPGAPIKKAPHGNSRRRRAVSRRARKTRRN